MNSKFYNTVVDGIECMVITSQSYSVKITPKLPKYEIVFLKGDLKPSTVTVVRFANSLQHAKRIARRYLKDGTITFYRNTNGIHPAGVNRGLAVDSHTK